MVNPKTMQKKQDYGIIINYIIRQYERWVKRRFDTKLHKLIVKAEDETKLTGYRYLIIKLYGRLRIVDKKRIKRWILDGTFKKGTTYKDIEKKAFYITKITPKYSR